MNDDPKQKEYARFQIRIPLELHAELLEAASRNVRTLNGEVTARLMGDPLAVALARQDRQQTEIKELAKQILDAVTK